MSKLQTPCMPCPSAVPQQVLLYISICLGNSCLQACIVAHRTGLVTFTQKKIPRPGNADLVLVMTSSGLGDLGQAHAD